MIDNFYKDFKIRDYMDSEDLKEQENYLDCSLGTNDFINGDIIRKYIVKCNYELNKYPIVEYELLKKELFNYWKEYNCNNISTDNISFGTGVMGILRNLSEFLINEKTTILGCAPQFPRFISEVELKRGNYDYYSLDESNNFKFNIDDFLKKMSKEHDVIHIENPNNPTGQVIDIKDIEKVVINAKKNNSIVIIDEAYGDYMDNSNSAITLVGKYDNLIVIRSASKFYGLPNHRVGYLFASEEIIKIYNEITIPFAFSDISAYVFRKILENHKDVDSSREKVYKIKKKILSSLDEENYLYTDMNTPIFTIKSDKYDNLASILRKNGILVEDCSTFINLDGRYARIRIPKEYERLLEVLKKIL